MAYPFSEYATGGFPYGTSSFAGEPRAGSRFTGYGRVGRTFTDATSSGPAYGVRPGAAGGASPSGRGSYYDRLTANDPFLRIQLKGISGEGTAAQGLLDATRSSLIGRYGETPSNAAFGFNPTQEARDLAQAQTLAGTSTSAVENRGYGQQNASDAALAAAHGLAHSGFVGQYMQQNLDTHNANVQANLDALLGSLGTAQQGYLGTQSTLRGQAADDVNAALTRQMAGIKAGVYNSTGYGTTPTRATTPVAAPTTQPLGGPVAGAPGRI